MAKHRDGKLKESKREAGAVVKTTGARGIEKVVMETITLQDNAGEQDGRRLQACAI